MQTKRHANLPQTLSAHFILEYMVNCSRVFKAFSGVFHKKETKEKKKGLAILLGSFLLSRVIVLKSCLYVTSKELL